MSRTTRVHLTVARLVLLLASWGCAGRSVGIADPPPSPTPSGASPTVLPAGPQFPGSGTLGAAEFSGASIACFFGGTKVTPAATVQHKLEVLQGISVVHVRLTLDPDFVDNTFGPAAIGWAASSHKAHTYRDLVGSDHAQLALVDGAGKTALEFKLDYISADATAPSGYRSLGVLGGDGKMISGDAAAILEWSSSLDRNLNERGYTAYTVSSPATDSAYSPNAAAPGWDFRVVYEVWVKTAALGPAGFGKAALTFLHASPSKASSNTVTVSERPCPRTWSGGKCDNDDCGAPSVPPPLTEAGGACVSSASCLSNRCTQGFCEASPSGGACHINGDCVVGGCTAAGLCATPDLTVAGHACNRAADCLSEKCTAGLCEQSGGGYACASGADCLSGLACIGGFCESGLQ